MVVERPWGSYETLHKADRVQVKLIIVQPGQKLSLQMHHHRNEHWVIAQGTASVQLRTLGHDEKRTYTEGQTVFIPIHTHHRLENPGKIPLHVVEVQTGPYLEEDDIVRFEDDYGRLDASVKPR